MQKNKDVAEMFDYFLNDDIPPERNKLTWESLSGKRFDRYLVKMGKAILELFDAEKDYSDIRIYFKDAFRDYFGIIDASENVAYKAHFSKKIINDYCDRFFSRMKYKPLFLYVENKRELNDIIDQLFSEESFNYIFSNICRQYIMSCMPDDDEDELTEDNYFITIGSGEHMIATAFSLLFERFFIEFQACIGQTMNQGISQAIQAEREAEIQKIKQEISKKIDECNKLSSKLSDTESQLKASNNKILQLNKKLTESIDERLKESNEYNDALRRENEKIRKQYKDLMRKYLESKNKEQGTISDAEQASIELPELNVNGRYAFIVYDDVTFRRSILDNFPNSIIIDSQTLIDPVSIDMVVVITTHIDHATYLGMKRQCKNKNIPLVHCEHSNIDLIKQLMLNTKMVA